MKSRAALILEQMGNGSNGGGTNGNGEMPPSNGDNSEPTNGNGMDKPKNPLIVRVKPFHTVKPPRDPSPELDKAEKQVVSKLKSLGAKNIEVSEPSFNLRIVSFKLMDSTFSIRIGAVPKRNAAPTITFNVKSGSSVNKNFSTVGNMVGYLRKVKPNEPGI